MSSTTTSSERTIRSTTFPVEASILDRAIVAVRLSKVNHRDLRDSHLAPDDRHELWREFVSRAADAGLYQLGGWAPLAREENEGDDDMSDYYDW